MNRSQTAENPRMVAPHIPGYDYGSPKVAKSLITVQEFELLKADANFIEEDVHWLREAAKLSPIKPRVSPESGATSSLRFPISPGTCSVPMEKKISNMARRADFGYSSGFSTPVSAPMIRTGCPISRRWPCAIPA